MLRGKIVDLESDVKCMLDHSVESEQRLLHFTEDLFTPKYANGPVLSHNCQSDKSTQTSLPCNRNDNCYKVLRGRKQEPKGTGIWDKAIYRTQ